MADDLINRKIAYAMLSEYYHHRTDIQHKALWDALSRVPSAEPRWIPVTERLPEYGAKCLVTAHAPDIDRLIIITSRCYVQKEGFWTDLPFTYKVTAWLPLPEPWKGEDDGEGKNSDLSS